MTATSAETPQTARVRLDKWLWAARFYKTRSAAAQAIDGGKVDIAGERAKRSRLVQAGDIVVLRRPPYEQQIVVRALSEVRGPAKEAALLYEETKESREARERLAYQLKNAPTLTFHGVGRPTKRDRRVIDKLKDGW
ncbi:MAG TPA: S4 domain-containing protein [Polyangia bacterium]|nr:S4 domain-containing protein [Polyangia bacterium]